MPIVQAGSINTTALVVPNLWVQIVPPQNLVINGVPTNRIGAVGTASWGPVNISSIVSSMADYARTFGPVMNRKFDMGTAVAAAIQQGAADFRCVRVTDGTDAAAAVVVQSTCVTLNALYTGTVGNSITAAFSAGSKSNSTRLVVTLPGLQPELFDNIGSGPNTQTTAASSLSVTETVASTAGLVVGMGVYGTGLTGSPTVASIVDATHFTYSAAQTVASGVNLSFAVVGNAFWLAVAAAVNTGAGQLRGPSQLISAAAGAGTTAVALSSYGLVGGTDGVATITTAVLIGVDTVPRKGMYALRKQGASIGMLADADDSTQWTTQAAFGLAEGIYMIAAVASGTAIANGTTGAVDIKAIAGLDSYAVKLMHGDWVYWNDQTNGVMRLISPQGFAAGRLANLSPEQSSLNKQLYSVVGSQKSGLPGSSQFQTYSDAELSSLFQVGIDVIANPQPGGNYWGVRLGHNTSSNPGTNGDNYTRMTNYLASTFNAGMGIYVGRVITIELLRQIRGTLLSFLQNLLQQGLLGLTLDGKLPFSVICDISNNPFTRTQLGYVQADVQVQYLAINEKFLVNLEGGQGVVVTRQTVPGGQV